MIYGVEYMNSILWFLCGLFVGLACDYILVKIMLKSIVNRIAVLEKAGESK